MSTSSTTIRDRVRENTPENKNQMIDEGIMESVDRYQNLSSEDIDDRLEKLKNEWDIERALEMNASSLALTGILLGSLLSRRFYLLTFAAAGFLLQHAIQGWCPPLSLLRSLGFRTRAEIDEEIYALKSLRGDFDNISSDSSPAEILAGYRK